MSEAEGGGLTTEDHESDDVSGPFRELQLNARAPRERHQGDSGKGEKYTHGAEGNVGGVSRAGGEVERTVEARDCSCESDEHLAERRVDLDVHRQSNEIEMVGGDGTYVEEE